MILSGIYSIECSINNGVYIGQTSSSNGFVRRWNVERCNLRSNKRENEHLLRAWKKYGENNFEFKIVEECEDSILNQREIFWISYYRYIGKNVYNFMDGGNKYCHHSIETKLKMRLARFGKKFKPMSEQGRINVSNAKIGIKQIKEHIEKCRMSRIGKVAYSRKIEKLNINGDCIKRYSSLIEAAREFGKTNSTPIQLACKNASTAYGFRWRYI